jgi:hypothetical protein
MKKLSMAQWCRELERQVATIKPAAALALNEIGEAVQERAKEKIGEYQGAVPPFRAWAPLAESTILSKTHEGYAPPDNPLLDTGEMRESISHEVAGLVLAVGSPSEIAKYQELGTVKMPPRSFLGASMMESLPVAEKVLGEAMKDVLSGGGGVARIISRK